MNDEYELDDNPAYAIAELLGMINRLTAERDQARSIATLLEAECSRCWGPVHAEALAVIHGA